MTRFQNTIIYLIITIGVVSLFGLFMPSRTFAALATSDIVATATSNVTTDTVTRVVTLPTSGVAEGMMMYIWMGITSTGDIGDVLTDPDGWDRVFTDVLPDTLSTPRGYLFKRLVPGGGLGSSVNITSSDSAISHVAMAFAVQNAAEAIEDQSTWASGTGSTATAAAASATTEGTLVFRLYLWDDDDEGTAPDPNDSHELVGGTHVEQATVGNGQTVHVYVETQAGTGTTGSSALASGNEEWGASTFIVAETVADTTPDAPGNLVTTSTTSGVDLTWDVPASDGGSNLETYGVWRATDPFTATTSATLITSFPTSTGTSYSDTSAQHGFTYYYRLAATNQTATSSLSNQRASGVNNGRIIRMTGIRLR